MFCFECVLLFIARSLVHASSARSIRPPLLTFLLLSPLSRQVNMIKDDGSVIQFTSPKVQAALAANTYAVTGHGENKSLTDIVPNLLNLAAGENFAKLKTKTDSTIEEVPEVETFDTTESQPEPAAPTEGETTVETI